MSHAVLLDIGPILLERIGRLAKAHGWAQQDAMIHLLEHGLFACESELAARFDASDARALQAAIAALQDVPDDPGFSLIGRADMPDDEGGQEESQQAKANNEAG